MKTNFILSLLAVSALLLVTGCNSMINARNGDHAGNTLYGYLYPQTTNAPVADLPGGTTTVTPPLHLGVAFLPLDNLASTHNAYGKFNSQLTDDEAARLAGELAAQLKARAFVGSVTVIPAGYLVPQGGFANLDRVRGLFNVDHVLLVSYDQVQYTDEGVLSLAYWTIVGAYVIPGENNETRTSMAAALLDIGSRRQELHAEGSSVVQAASTLINLNEHLRADGQRGFAVAMTNLQADLEMKLTTFAQQVKP